MKMVQRVQLTKRNGIEVIVDHLEGELELRNMCYGAISAQIGLVAMLAVAKYLKWLQTPVPAHIPRVSTSKSRQTTWLDGHKVMTLHQTGSLNELRLTRGEVNGLATWVETDPATFAEVWGEIPLRWRAISTLLEFKTTYEVEFDNSDAYLIAWGAIEPRTYDLAPGTEIKITYEEVGKRILEDFFPDDKRALKADPARVGWLASLTLYKALHAGSGGTRLLDDVHYDGQEVVGGGITATRNSRRT